MNNGQRKRDYSCSNEGGYMPKDWPRADMYQTESGVGRSYYHDEEFEDMGEWLKEIIASIVKAIMYLLVICACFKYLFF